MLGPRILLVDNYDSFTWNLVQGLAALGATVDVVPNDARLDDVQRRPADGYVISPGPGTPADAGITCALIRSLRAHQPLLGVCLGHQTLGLAFGATLRRAPQVRHGKTSPVTHTADGVFAGLPQATPVMRYHSLILDAASIPDVLQVTARATDDGAIMGVRHRELPFEGVQFHPESIGTLDGSAMLANFLRHVRRHRQRAAA